MLRGPESPLAGRHVVVGVCGGIAAYKSAYLVRELVARDARVSVVMTASARKFIGEQTLEALSGSPVYYDLFDRRQEADIGHIKMADTADILIIAPATANTIARLAAGLADDALAAVALATRATILLAPAMNVNMWENPITQRNIATLAELRNARIVGPDSGFLACGWTGPGRMAEPADIVFAAESLASDRDLEGRRVVVTSGPTREAIDPVRFLSNRSSGKMGHALARIAIMRGAAVTLITGPSEEAVAPGVNVVAVTTAEQMREAVMEHRSLADAIVLAAAVADYRPMSVADSKLKKNAWGQTPSIELTRTRDILGELGAERGGAGTPVLVGFAAETRDVASAARAKLQAKGCDLIVANDVSEAGGVFGGEDNQVTLVSAAGNEDLPRMTKTAVAHRVWTEVAKIFAERDR